MELKIFLVLTIFLQAASPSKILALMTVPSHSHHLWSKIVLEAVAARGHEVTYLGVDEYKSPPKNIRHIFLDHAYDLYGVMNFTSLSMGSNPYQAIIDLDDWEDIAAISSSKQTGFQEFLKIIKNEKFDLVMFDSGTTAYLLGAVDVLGRPPVMGITTFSVPSWTFDWSGSPYPIQYNPHMMVKYGPEMTFFERLNNAGLFLFGAIHRWRHLENQDAISKEVFGPNVRHVSDISDDINVNIVNANWVTDYPFPHTPGMIPIAGVHIAPVKPLPADLKEILDKAVDGVIYFSLGSNIQSAFLHEAEISALTEAFRQLAPLKILWKYEKDTLKGKPDNVIIRKWLPQNDILAHPNVRLFFTHGGMLSTTEAYYHGVPIVGMPIFLDQHVNIKKAYFRGIGESLELTSLRTDTIVRTIRKVVGDDRYKQKAVELSRIFRDQPSSAIDQVIYWTEYVIRHKGAPHLRPASKNLNWFQNGLYDIILTFLASICFVLYVLFKCLKIVFRLICQPNKRKVE